MLDFMCKKCDLEIELYVDTIKQPNNSYSYSDFRSRSHIEM